MDRRTENTIHRAAWSQLKNIKQSNCVVRILTVKTAKYQDINNHSENQLWFHSYIWSHHECWLSVNELVRKCTSHKKYIYADAKNLLQPQRSALISKTCECHSFKCVIHWIISTFWFYSESIHATFELNPWMPLQTSHINFRYSSWNDLGEENVRVSCQWTEKTSPQTDDITRAGVTKATVMKCIRDNFILP